MYAWRYIYSVINESKCMYKCVGVHTYVCMYAFMHSSVPNLYFSVTVYIFHISLNKYDCHIPNMRFSAIVQHEDKDSTFFAHICQNTSNYTIYFTCYCHVCASNKWTSQVPHIQISSCAHDTAISV